MAHLYQFFRQMSNRCGLLGITKFHFGSGFLSTSPKTLVKIAFRPSYKFELKRNKQTKTASGMDFFIEKIIDWALLHCTHLLQLKKNILTP